MNNTLKELFHIQQVLQSKGYFDISRISSEILECCQNDSKKIEKVLYRIKNDEPWEYIRGYTEFCGHKFLVNKHTLIPRIETEQLVDIAQSLDKEENFKQIIDVGTGSGCIIISLYLSSHSHTEQKYYATDISKQALLMAKKNAKLHKITEIVFSQSDLLKDINLEKNSLIIANLPYIPQHMFENLDKSVSDFEPHNALLGGDDGLMYYKKLIKQIEKKQNKSHLLIEIEPTTLKKLQEYLKRDTLVIKDYRNQKRFVLIRF